MDPDTEAAVMAQLEQFAASARGGVPGEFPGSEDADSDAEAGTSGAGAAGVVQFFRGLWGSQQSPSVGEQRDVAQESEDDNTNNQA